MITPNYNAPMWLLYGTSRLLLTNCDLKLADFEDYSLSYTDAMLLALNTEVNAAEALPSEEMRSLEHSQLLAELKPLFKITQRKMMYLKRYITKAFPKDQWAINWSAAGLDMYYTDMNWTEAKNMYAKALLYIADKKAVLIADANMPAAFDTGFATAVTNYNTKLTAFVNAKVASVEGTDEKIAANNAIYEKIIDLICEVGQTIFADDETLKREFSFEKMSEQLRPMGPAGLKGVVKKDGVPQPGVIVELENGNKSVITDADGAFDFGHNLASGTDTVIVKQGDEILGEEEVTIPPGVLVREDIELPSTPLVV